jgi:predicted HicB family RNase H-like nuclease
VKSLIIHLDKNLIEQCKRLAKRQNITLNQLIVQTIKELIKTQELENDRQI